MPEQKNIEDKTYLFIDESGDPAFYASGNRSIVGTEGFKPLLLVGMIKLADKRAIRKAIVNFMEDLKNDTLYNSRPVLLILKAGIYMPATTILKCRLSSLIFSVSWKGLSFIV